MSRSVRRCMSAAVVAVLLLSASPAAAGWRPDRKQAIRYIETRSGKVSFAVKTPSDRLVHYRGKQQVPAASVIKAMSLGIVHGGRGRARWPRYACSRAEIVARLAPEGPRHRGHAIGSRRGGGSCSQGRPASSQDWSTSALAGYRTATCLTGAAGTGNASRDLWLAYLRDPVVHIGARRRGESGIDEVQTVPELGHGCWNVEPFIGRTALNYAR